MFIDVWFSRVYQYTYRSTGDAAPTDTVDAVPFNRGRFENVNSSNPVDVYIYCRSSVGLSGKVIVQNGLDNHKDVSIQDQHTELIDLYVTQLIDTCTVTSNTEIDDTDIDISSATAPVAGNIICLKEGTAFYQGQVLSFTGTGPAYNVVVDNPLDYAYTTVGGCSIRSENLNVNASHATPQIFNVSPVGLVDPNNQTDGQKWDIVRVIFTMTDATAMDDGKFGAMDKLTNGIVIRKKNGTYKNIFNAKSNGDFRLHSYDVEYISDTQGPSGLFGFGSRRTFGGQSKNGVTIRLDADDNDEFQIIVQDDLTGLNSFKVVVQGHVVD